MATCTGRMIVWLVSLWCDANKRGVILPGSIFVVLYLIQNALQVFVGAFKVLRRGHEVINLGGKCTFPAEMLYISRR